MIDPAGVITPWSKVFYTSNFHIECEEAFSNLLSSPAAQSLSKVMLLLTEHFQQKESKMKSFCCGRPGNDQSSYENHVRDHKRILDIGFNALAKNSKIAELDMAFLSMTCSEIKVNTPDHAFLSMTCPEVQINQPDEAFLSMTCRELQANEPDTAFLSMMCTEIKGDHNNTVQHPVQNNISSGVDKSVAEQIIREIRLHLAGEV